MKRVGGFPHIQSARKGPGSLEDGIEFLKSYDIIVHPNCKHVIDELASYSYKTDKLTGEILPGSSLGHWRSRAGSDRKGRPPPFRSSLPRRDTRAGPSPGSDGGDLP